MSQPLSSACKPLTEPSEAAQIEKDLLALSNKWPGLISVVIIETLAPEDIASLQTLIGVAQERLHKWHL